MVHTLETENGIRRSQAMSRSLAGVIIAVLLSMMMMMIQVQADPVTRGFTKIHPVDLLSAHADFGSAVALVGNFVAIGAQNDRGQNGTVFIYSVNSSSNTSTLVDVLTAPDTLPFNGSNFGCALVAVNDDMLIVGAQFAEENAGAVFVYHVDQHSGHTTMVQEIPHPMRDGSSTFFGGSISATGDFLLIGASSGNGTGAAFLYHRRNEQQWRLNRSFDGSDFPIGANFGINVAVTPKGWVGIGVNNADNTSGILVLYPPPPVASNASSSSDSPVWVVLPDLLPGAFFGTSIVLIDDLVDDNAVLWFSSAPFQANGSVVAGRAFRWGNFSVSSVIVPPSSPSVAISPSGACFGASMAYNVASDQLFVGAWSYGGGAVFVYNTTLEASMLSLVLVDAIVPYPSDLIYFGSAIAMSRRGSLVVGAFADFADEGSAFYFASRKK